MAPGHFNATPQGRTQLIDNAADKKVLLEQVHALSHQLQRELNYFDNTPLSLADTAVNTSTERPLYTTVADKQAQAMNISELSTDAVKKNSHKHSHKDSHRSSWLKNIDDLDIDVGRKKTSGSYDLY